mmetsp:Transcript_27908/g.90190  ORF Transcript_27908/g.90190 Transcript_27908/m.90190 type:complete len:215 (-) Transcript_27908:903-1547(-)
MRHDGGWHGPSRLMAGGRLACGVHRVRKGVQATYVSGVAMVVRVGRRYERDLHVRADILVGLGMKPGDRDVPTVCEHIEANELRLQVDSQVAHPLETEEEERRDAGRPADDGEHPYGGGTEQPGRAVEQPRVALGAVDRAGEQGGREGAPDAAGAVDGKGIEGVVHLEDDQDQPRRAQVDERAHHAHHQGELRWDAGAAGSDRDQAAQDAVAGL